MKLQLNAQNIIKILKKSAKEYQLLSITCFKELYVEKWILLCKMYSNTQQIFVAFFCSLIV